MGKRTDLERRLATLSDIKAVLRVMRSLALLETGKLSRFLPAQRRVVGSIEEAAADFLQFNPGVPVPGERADVLILIGTERGFCGAFNEAVLDALTSLPVAARRTVIAVGSRLCGKAPPQLLQGAIPGACSVEEVPSVLSRVVGELNGLPGEPGGLRLTVLSHGWDDEGVKATVLQPFPPLVPSRFHPYPPLLNLRLDLFYAGLVEEYLFARLHELFYLSLMAENVQRQRHIESAARRMELKISELKIKNNRLRQEEIVEEIETIMLSVDSPLPWA